MMALARTAREWPRIWREEGKVELLREQATRKFGQATGAALARRMEQVQDANAVDKVSGWILECNTESELREKLDGLSRSDG